MKDTERTEAARAMGRARTDKKAAAVRANGRKGGPPRRVFAAGDITAETALKIHRAAMDAAWGIGGVVNQIIDSTVTPAGAAREINRLLATIERATK